MPNEKLNKNKLQPDSLLPEASFYQTEKLGLVDLSQEYKDDFSTSAKEKKTESLSLELDKTMGPISYKNLKSQRTLSWSGDSMNKYKVGKRAGSGSTSIVYKAQSEQDEEELALKVEKKSSVSGSLSKGTEPRELQALKRIAHPNIVGLRKVANDETSDKLVVVTEHLDGTQLS